MAFSTRMRDLMKKYEKVTIGVHLSVSFASIGGLYVSINNNVDVESLFQKVGLSSVSVKDPADPNPNPNPIPNGSDPTAVNLYSYESTVNDESKKRNWTVELAASSGGALALAILCNKALFPIRVPITITLTPPIARFLARRSLIKHY